MSDLYSDGSHYDALLGEQTADIEFYRKEALAAKGPVLEIACGTGRITLPLAETGIDILGLDLSEAMLARAREKAAEQGLTVEWALADARDFNLGKKFRLIFFPYNSMQHLHDHGSLEAMFSCVRRHLEPGGRFILDVHNPSLALLNRQRGEIFPVAGLDGTLVTGEEVGYDDAKQVYTIRWHYSSVDGADPRVDELKLRMFFPQELDALLNHNGFEIIEKFGDFNRGAFAPGSGKQVVICRLK